MPPAHGGMQGSGYPGVCPAACGSACGKRPVRLRRGRPGRAGGEYDRGGCGGYRALEGGGMSFEIKGVSEEEEVKPSDPSGYFYYYEDIEGWHYYVVSGVIHNPEQEILSPEDFDVQAVRGNSCMRQKPPWRTARPLRSWGKERRPWPESPGLFLIVMVEDGKEPPKEVTLYYNEGLGEKKDTEQWDHGSGLWCDGKTIKAGAETGEGKHLLRSRTSWKRSSL